MGGPARSASRADAFSRYACTAACPWAATPAPRAHHWANSVAPLTVPAAVSRAAAARMAFTKLPSSAKSAVVPAAQVGAPGCHISHAPEAAMAGQGHTA